MMSWPILLILVSFTAFAQTELDTIEVQATKDLERFTFDTSSTISTKDLEDQPIGLIVPALEKTPGVTNNQNGGPGGQVSFFIRGTESRHISYTLDGLKINDTSNTGRQFDAAFITSPFVKEIIVHRGPQAVLYGSDALGGMIEIKTRKGENAPNARLSINAGSFGTMDTSLSKDWKTKNDNGSLTFSRFHTDGISRLNKKRYHAHEKDATDITQITSSSEHRWADKFQTDVLASFLHGRAEQDGFASDNNNDFSQNDQYVLQQKTNYEINSTQAISLRNGFNRHQRHNESLAYGQEFFNGNLLQNELIHRLEKGNFGFLSGLSTEHESAALKGLDRSFDLTSAFVQSAYGYHKFKFHAGVRADHHSKYGSFFTGSSGISYDDFSLQYSQGYKAPSLYQLYAPYSGGPIGNPNLVPETNHSWEAAWKKKTDMFEGGVAFFQNRLSNQFTFTSTKGYLNQQRYISEGVELSGKVKLKSFQIYSSLTHQDFKEEEVTILRRPYNSALLSFSYFPVETVELNATERWFSSRKDLDAAGNVVKLNGYQVTDLSVRKTWEEDEVAVQLRNVFNKEYEELYGFSVMPRSVFVNYGHQFQ
jgi:vitamin B12 transporter